MTYLPSPPENPAPALGGPIQEKRGAESALPTLFDGELALTWSVSSGDWNKLYVGTPSGTNRLLLDADAVAAAAALAFGGDLSGTYSAQTVTGIQGHPVSTTAPSAAGQVLTWNGTAYAPATPTAGAPTGSAGGDLYGTYPSPSVGALRGVPLSTTTPTDGQVLAYSASLTRWVPTTVSGSGGSGTVTSVNLSMPGGFAVSGTPLTSSGTLAVTTTLSGLLKGDGAGNIAAATAGTDYLAPFGAEAANTVFAGPDAVSGLPAFRALLPSDLPAASSSAKGVVQLTGDLAGTAAAPVVAAVQGQAWGTTAPAPGQFPTWSGTNWTPHTLTGSDLPVFGPSGASHAPGAVPDPGSTAGTTRYLREDGNWSPIASGAGGTVTDVSVTVPGGLSATVTDPTGAASVAITNTLADGLTKTASGAFATAAAGTDYVAPSDSRLTDSRTPTGAAGGDLAGTYPNPTLVASGVTAGTYGDATHVPSLTLDAKGRVTAAASVAISGGGGGGSFTAGGDLSGTSTSQTVIGLQGHSLTAPSSAGFLRWTGTAWAYAAGTTPTGMANTVAGYDGSGNLASVSPLTWDTNNVQLVNGKGIQFLRSTSGYWTLIVQTDDLVWTNGSSIAMFRLATSEPGVGAATVYNSHLVLPPTDGFGNALLWAKDQTGTVHRASTGDGVEFLNGIKIGSSPLPRPVYSETPTGSVNGTNTHFTLAHIPIGDAAAVYLGADATHLYRIAPTAYTVTDDGTTATLTMASAPASGYVLLVDYSY